MRTRAFSLVEMMAVVAVAGVVTAAGMASLSALTGEARRRDQARAALMQMKKVRADALASSSGAAIEAVPRPGGGVRLTTATVPRMAGSPPCADWPSRATSIDVVDYDLLALSFPRPDDTLCFESSGFRLMDVDGTTLAPAPIAFDVFPADSDPGKVTIQPSGAVAASFDDGVQEGLAATVNTPAIPAADDPARHVVGPAQLEPEAPVIEQTPPPNPTQPPGQPVIEAQPAAEAAPPPPPPPACNDDPDCPAGFHCAVPPNTCEPDPPACTSDADCPDIDQECDTASGQCEYGCNTFLCPETGSCTPCEYVYCCMQYGCLCA